MHSSLPGARRRALVVACCYPQSSLALEGPEFDALFYEHMLRQFGFDDVRTLSDRKLGMESSQRGNVIRGVQWLVADARPGDNLVFVFSGHGTAAASIAHDRRDYMDRALCCSDYDTSQNSNLLLDVELQALFSPLPPGVLLTCILDCPFGDTIAKLPWYYDAKNGSFAQSQQVRKSSIWPGSRCMRRSSYTVRGTQPGRGVARPLPGATAATPSGAAAAAAARAGCAGARSNHAAPRDLFPGVAAFLLCACRPDQICLESTGVQSRPQGVFSSCLAAVLQQSLHGGVQPGCGLSYFDLARSLEACVQAHMAEHGLAQQGFAQNVMLGFTMHPEDVRFLHPPTDALKAIPRPFGGIGALEHDEAVRTGILASFTAAEIGPKRSWPHVLIQLCRLSPEGYAAAMRSKLDCDRDDIGWPLDPFTRALHDCEVVGELWLPALSQLFPETTVVPEPGQRQRQNARTVFEGGTPRSKRRSLVRELEPPAIGTAHQRYTWAATTPSGLRSDAVGSNDNFVNAANQYDGLVDSLPIGMDCRPQERSTLNPISPNMRLVQERLALVFRDNPREVMARLDPKGCGLVSSTQFEYFCIRRLNLDLHTARRAFVECCLATPVRGSFQRRRVDSNESEDAVPLNILVEVLWPPSQGSLQATTAFGAVGQMTSDTRYTMPWPDRSVEAHMDLEWSVGNAEVASLKICNFELRRKAALEETDYARSGVYEHLDEHVTARSCIAGPNSQAGRSRVFGDEQMAKTAFFIRVGLSASRNVTAPLSNDSALIGAQDAPEVHDHGAAWVVPHVVYISSALWRSTCVETGELCMKVMPDVAAVPRHTGATVPICTAQRLTDLQRLALSLPRSCDLPSHNRLGVPADALVDSAGAGHGLSYPTKSPPFARTGSEPYDLHRRGHCK